MEERAAKVESGHRKKTCVNTGKKGMQTEPRGEREEKVEEESRYRRKKQGDREEKTTEEESR